MPKKEESKELFDFSRVDQERIQEEDALRSNVTSKTDSGSDYSLQRELKKTSVIQAIKTAPVSMPTDGQKRTYFKKAWTFFFTYSIGIPLILIGGTWSFFTLLEKTTSVGSIATPDISQSEVIKALEQSKNRRKIQIEYAKIIVRTQPSPAMVYVDSKLVSTFTPFQISQLVPNTSLQLRVTKPGYEDAVRLLNLDPNEERVLDIKLERAR